MLLFGQLAFLPNLLWQLSDQNPQHVALVLNSSGVAVLDHDPFYLLLKYVPAALFCKQTPYATLSCQQKITLIGCDPNRGCMRQWQRHRKDAVRRKAIVRQSAILARPVTGAMG